MDEATATKILQNYGAPMTPANMMKVMSQSGPADAILAKSMGLQGATDESGNALDKLAFTSERAPTAPVIATPTNAALTETPIPAQAPVVRGTPKVAPVIKGGGASAATEPDVPLQGNPTEAGYNAPSIWQWLLPALGITSVAGRAAMGGAGASSEPNTKLEGPPVTPISGATPQTDSIDKLISQSNKAATIPESRRPTNTNADERNSQLLNKPVNMDTKPQVKGPYDGEPTNLVEEIAKTIKNLKGVRK